MGFSIATFNVRDLFDTQPPHVIGDLDCSGEYSDAARAVAARLYAARLETIASTLARLDADVVALQEVKNERVLLDLRERLAARTAGLAPYVHLVAATSDSRGIACGLLSRFPLAACREHRPTELEFPVFVEGDAAPFAGRLGVRRAMLEAVLSLPDGSSLTVIVAHLKSGLPTPRQLRDGTRCAFTDHRALADGHLRSLVSRVSEALFLRGLVDERLASDPNAQIAIAGDLNDVPGSPVLRSLLGDFAVEVRAAYGTAIRPETASGFAGRALHACAEAIPADRRFTVIYRGERQQLDHILVSAALWQRYRRAEILNEDLREIYGAIGDGGTASLESDHAPLRAEFT